MDNKMILITTAVLSIICSLLGILTPIYSDIEWINAQVRGQDAITIAAAVFLLIALRFRQPAKEIVTAGISAYLVYTYFFYALEVNLNVLFFCYLAILLLSIILLVRSINFLRTTDTMVPKNSYRMAGIIFMGIMALILTVLWSGDVIANLTGEPLLKNPTNEPFTIVYVLDLTFVVPAVVYAIVKSVQNKKIGYYLTGVMLIVITVMGLALMGMTGGLMLAGLSFDLFLAVFWAFLGTIGIVLAALYIRSLARQARREARQ